MTLNDAYETLRAHQLWRKGMTSEQVKPKAVSQAIDLILAAYDNSSMTITIPRVDNDYYRA